MVRLPGRSLVLSPSLKVAYRVNLPPGSKIHDVIQISKLKAFTVSVPAHISIIPAEYFTKDHPLTAPVVPEVRNSSSNGSTEYLVSWADRAQGDASWISAADYEALFGSIRLEDKDSLRIRVM